MYYIKSSQIVLNNRKVVYDITVYKTAVHFVQEAP